MSNAGSASASPAPGAGSSRSTSNTPAPAVNRHALTPLEKQRSQLEKLLKDPAKPAYIPPAPKQKTIRPAREMMKNVQGSSAGAGSGEFHVYKASRRREYERLKLLEEEATKEVVDAEFERKRREAEEAAEAKTAKNRAKRQKKKDRAKVAAARAAESSHNDATTSSGRQEGGTTPSQDIPIKKRRLVNGKELVFRKPGEEDEEDADSDAEEEGPQPTDQGTTESRSQLPKGQAEVQPAVAVVNEPRVVIHEDD
ncbi:hypothetical protein AX16_001717 [Volvariella volvacea WC 439]|nr:hypothetical protein AX16_001717 [Volvariella volvacea WC 439]